MAHGARRGLAIRTARSCQRWRSTRSYSSLISPVKTMKVQGRRPACIGIRLLVATSVAAASRAHGDRSFEAASVKRRAPAGPVVQMLMNITPGRLHFQVIPLKDCIRWAYGVVEYQIRGGPDWIDRSAVGHRSGRPRPCNRRCDARSVPPAAPQPFRFAGAPGQRPWQVILTDGAVDETVAMKTAGTN